jgi:endogenous inhibitor of DNA gyrase (YacG/DUF329 family)
MPALRCPLCGTPIPDTGMSSWAGVGPPDGSRPEIDPGAWRQHAACPSCGKDVVRNPQAEAPSLTEWRVERPLLQLGGTAIMRAGDMPGGAADVHYGRSHISGGGKVATSGTATRYGRGHISGGGTIVYDDSASGIVTVSGSGIESHSVLPERVDVSRATWDITCTGFGAGIGLAVMGQAGMVIGGVAAYMWGRRRWLKG